MEVFHYVAHQLLGEPLFDRDVEAEEHVGAVYNDFDASPMSLLLTPDECAQFSFSQPSKQKSSPSKTSTAIEEALDHAVIDADNAQGLFYEHLVWETPLFDNASEKCDEAYLEKVFKLITDVDGCWSDDVVITEQAAEMFRRRFRTQWEASDSVYDAWLLIRGWERPWFDRHLFDILYPGVVDDLPPAPVLHKRKRQRHNALSSSSSSEEGSSREEEIQRSPSAHSTPKVIRATVASLLSSDGTSSSSSSDSSDDTHSEAPTDDDGRSTSYALSDDNGCSDSEALQLTQNDPEYTDYITESESETDASKVIKAVLDSVEARDYNL